MTETSSLDFLPPPKRKRLRFSLRVLLFVVTCAGPIALVAAALPDRYYWAQSATIVFIGLVMLGAWLASYARPTMLVASSAAAVAVSGALLLAILTAWPRVAEMTVRSLLISSVLALVSILALGLSWSRYSQ